MSYSFSFETLLHVIYNQNAKILRLTDGRYGSDESRKAEREGLKIRIIKVTSFKDDPLTHKLTRKAANQEATKPVN